MGKKGDFRDFERGIAVDARQAGLKFAQNCWGLSHKAISRVYRECCGKGLQFKRLTEIGQQKIGKSLAGLISAVKLGL